MKGGNVNKLILVRKCIGLHSVGFFYHAMILGRLRKLELLT